MKTEEVNEKKLESFVIANPIYDTAFRKFMGNRQTVKFFIGTILEQQIEDVYFLPQKHPYGEELDYVDFFIFRLYIIASVCTDEGKCEKRLIEVLKSWKTIDVIYFRDYTGNLHTKEVIIDGEKTTMPITTIYILGGDILPEIDCPCIKVGHICTDMMKRIEIKTKSEFIEELAPDCYVIQAGRRITDRRYTTDLDNLLGIFEQDNFVTRDSDTLKGYYYPAGDENMELITSSLRNMAAHSEERKEIESEREALRIFNNALITRRESFEEENKVRKEKAKLDKALEEKDKAIEEDKKVIEEQAKVQEEDKKTIKEQEEMIKQLTAMLNSRQN